MVFPISKVALTQNEFNLLLRGILQGWSSDSCSDVLIEHGKGSDIHYSRTVTRLSDGATFNVEFTWNGDFGGYQDWIHGGDFYIDPDKEDIYNDCGKLISEEKPQEVEEKTEFQLTKEEHDRLSSQGGLTKIDESYAVPPEKLEAFIEALCETRSKNRIIIKLIPNASLEAYKVANEYKVEAPHLWAFFNRNTTTKKIKMKLKEYRKNYEVKHNLKG